MRRFFVKNLLFIIALNLLVKPIWVFMIDRTVQNRVGHESYGTYQALLSICSMFQILLDLGLTNYNTNIISQNPGKLKAYYPAMLTTKLFLTAIFLVVVMTTGIISHYSAAEILLLFAISFISLLNSLVQYLRSNVAALQKFKLDGILSVSDRLLMIVVCGYLLYSPATAANFKIEWFVMTQVGCYAVAAIAGFFFIYKLTRSLPGLSFNTGEVMATIRKSLPFALMVFLMGIHTTSDRMLIERLGSKDEAGIYASAYRLLDVSTMFGVMFAGVLLPMFGKMMATKQSVQPVLKLSVNLLLPFAFTLFGIAAFWGQDVMHLLYKGAGAYDGRIFAWVMAAFPAYCIMYTYSTLLTANGNIPVMIKISIAGVIISLGLNMYMIPHYFAMGAAITAFITQTILAVCYIIFCGREIQLPTNVKWIGAHILFLFLLAIGGYALSLSQINWMLQVVIFGCLSLTGIFSFRFLSVSGIKMLMQKN